MSKSLFDFVLLVKLLQGGSSSGVPEVLSIENVGIDGLGYYLVRFFDTDGLTLLATKWVKAGDDVDTDVSPFSNDEITILNQNGATIESSSVTDQVGEISGYEYSAGYEGMNIRLDNLTPGGTYIVSFKYQTTSGAYFSPGQYTYGYKVFDSPVTSYPTVSQASSGYMPLVEDLNEHAYTLQFTPSDETAYLVFAFPQYSDSVRNYFSIRDLCVKSIMDDVWAVTANSGVIATNILDDVQQDMDLYRARWKVSYWNRLGTFLLHEEYVIDGEDAVWGASKDWSNEAEGEVIAGILENVSTNINVYKVQSYVALDWIQSSGTQWIDTGVAGNTENLKVRLEYMPTAGYASEYAVFGSAWTANAYLLILYQNKWRFHNKGGYTDDGVADTSDFSVIETEPTQFSVNGTPYQVSGSGGNDSSHITIFKAGNRYGYGRLKSYEMWVNDILIHDFHPALDEHDVACLYDEISGEYFYNAGSGEFVYPREPQAIAWIQSSGTQYIRTGYYPNMDTHVEMYCNIQPYSTNDAPFGSRVAAYNNMFYVVARSNGASDPNASWAYGAAVNKVAASTSANLNEDIIVSLDANGASFGDASTSFSGTGVTGAAELFLFQLNQNGSPFSGAACKMTLYYCKIYENNVLVHHFKPYLDDLGVACLYDEVTQQFYHNAGTGMFGYPYDPTPAEAQLKADMALTDYCRLSYAMGDGATFNGRYFTRTSNAPPVVFMNIYNADGWATYAVVSKYSSAPEHTYNSYGNLISAGTIVVNGVTLYIFGMSGWWRLSPAGITFTVDGATVTFPNNSAFLRNQGNNVYAVDGNDAQSVADANILLARFASM